MTNAANQTLFSKPFTLIWHQVFLRRSNWRQTWRVPHTQRQCQIFANERSLKESIYLQQRLTPCQIQLQGFKLKAYISTKYAKDVSGRPASLSYNNEILSSSCHEKGWAVNSPPAKDEWSCIWSSCIRCFIREMLFCLKHRIELLEGPRVCHRRSCFRRPDVQYPFTKFELHWCPLTAFRPLMKEFNFRKPLYLWCSFPQNVFTNFELCNCTGHVHSHIMAAKNRAKTLEIAQATWWVVNQTGFSSWVVVRNEHVLILQRFFHLYSPQLRPGFMKSWNIRI